jgi:hypothetical protein
MCLPKKIIFHKQSQNRLLGPNNLIRAVACSSLRKSFLINAVSTLEAWQIILTTFGISDDKWAGDDVSSLFTVVSSPFTEGLLRQIAPEAWRVIVTTFQGIPDEVGNDDVTEGVTLVTSPPSLAPDCS